MSSEKRQSIELTPEHAYALLKILPMRMMAEIATHAGNHFNWKGERNSAVIRDEAEKIAKRWDESYKPQYACPS